MQARDAFSASGSTEVNKAFVRRYTDEANNGGDLSLVDTLMAPDYVWHDGPPSCDELKRFLAWQRASAPDWHISIQDLVAEGDRVAVRGKRTEGSPGVPFPHPLYVELTWIAIYRCEASRIAEVWVVTRMWRRLDKSFAACASCTVHSCVAQAVAGDAVLVSQHIALSCGWVSGPHAGRSSWLANPLERVAVPANPAGGCSPRCSPPRLKNVGKSQAYKQGLSGRISVTRWMRYAVKQQASGIDCAACARRDGIT